MNRSFRAQESLMPSIRPRMAQLRSLKEPTPKEKEDDLALFLEMRKREKEKTDLLQKEELDESLGVQGSTTLYNIPPAPPARKNFAEEFLNSENDKNDYDWLLTPPGTPLFPSLESESRRVYQGENEAPNARPITLKSRMDNSLPDSKRSNSLLSRQPSSSPVLSSSASGIRRPSSSGGRPSSSGGRPSSSGGPASRPGTPTGRSSVTSSSRPATPTGRPALTSSSRTSRPSTPTSRPTLSSTSIKSSASLSSTSRSAPGLISTRSTISTASAKSAAASRSSTPKRSSTPSRTTARSSTPTSTRPTISAPSSRTTSRTSTPTRRPSTPSRALPGGSNTSSMSRSTSLVNKMGPAAATKNPAPSRGTSPTPTVRARPWKPSEMPGFSLDAPPNLRTTLPDRPLSATRGRPGAPAARSASVDPIPNAGRHRRQSPSPSRGRAPNGVSKAYMSGCSVPAVSRAHTRINDNVSPVMMGNKMVERVINMRRLAPPRQDDDKHSPSLSGKSASSPDSSGFGRTLSKKSLDMAIRHMDIRRTIPGNLRPLMTNIPASSMYSVRSGPTRSRTISVSDSPLATSSNTSSELSVNNNPGTGILDGCELEDDHSSERGMRASAAS